MFAAVFSICIEGDCKCNDRIRDLGFTSAIDDFYPFLAASLWKFLQLSVSFYQTNRNRNRNIPLRNKHFKVTLHKSLQGRVIP